MSIRRWWGDRWLRRQLRQVQHQPPPQPLTRAYGTLVVFSAETLLHQQEAQRLADDIAQMTGEHAYLLGYFHKYLGTKVTFAFPHLSLRDVVTTPDFSRMRTDHYMRSEFRYCVNLDLSRHALLHYLCARVRAQHKWGVDGSYSGLYQVILSDEGKTDANIEDLCRRTAELFKRINDR